jgi:putative transposase
VPTITFRILCCFFIIEHGRRKILDHVIILDENHLRGLIRDYISYYHDDRTHDSLDKDWPATHAVSSKPDSSANLISFPRIGGLHHRYDWQQAD